MHLKARSSQRNESGVALLLALMTLLLVGGIATLLFTRSMNEMRHSRDDTAIVQTLMLARGGANIGGALLSSDVHNAFRNIIEDTATPGRWAFGSDGDGWSSTGPDPGTVTNALAAPAAMLQEAVDGMVCLAGFLPHNSAGEVSVRVHFTGSACGQPLPDTVTLPNGRFVDGPPRSGTHEVQEYALPFVMISEAELADHRRNIVVQGEYRFEVGQSSFARYAYFTNRDSSTNSQIWFTGDTMIDGPVHTNGNFAFYQDPWFGGRVTSAGCTPQNLNNGHCDGATNPGGFFYDRQSDIRSPGSMGPDDQRPVFGENAPDFEDGVSWTSQYVPLPENAFDQKAVALGSGGRSDVGIHLDYPVLNSLDIWAGDGDGNSPEPSVDNQGRVSWEPNATHQFVRACRPEGWSGSEVCETWRIDSSNTLQKLDENSNFSNPDTWVWDTDARPFNGVIYNAGEIERFRGPERRTGPGLANDGSAAPPAVAAFSELTVVAENDVRLTRDITYEQPPCHGVPVRNSDNRTVTRADCSDTETENVLGVYTPGGDVIVGNDNSQDSLNAPYDMYMHGVLMSASNQIRVEGYEERNSYSKDRGRFHLLGGMIQENRGVFGTFQAGVVNGRKGYDRVYTYDPRMSQGVAPPYFPTTGLDTVDAVRVFSFGQREQVY